MHTSINPWTGEILGSFPLIGSEQLEARLQAAHQAQRHWRTHVPTFSRAEPVAKLAQILAEQREPLATMITSEMGKLYRESLAEIDKCIWLCQVFAEQGAEWLEPEHIPTEAKRSYVQPIPLGVILLVMPWNFPFWQVIRAAIPALMAGNAIVLKHASNVPQSALALERLFLAAGFNDGLFKHSSWQAQILMH